MFDAFLHIFLCHYPKIKNIFCLHCKILGSYMPHGIYTLYIQLC